MVRDLSGRCVNFSSCTIVTDGRWSCDGYGKIKHEYAKDGFAETIDCSDYRTASDEAERNVSILTMLQENDAQIGRNLRGAQPAFDNSFFDV